MRPWVSSLKKILPVTILKTSEDLDALLWEKYYASNWPTVFIVIYEAQESV